MKFSFWINQYRLIFGKSLSRKIFKPFRRRLRQLQGVDASQTFSTKEKVTIEIVLLLCFVLTVACIISFILGKNLSQDNPIQGLETLIGLILALPIFDLIKGFIETSIDGLPDAEQPTKKRIDSSLSEENAREHRYYLSRILSNNSTFKIGDLKLSDVETSITNARTTSGDQRLTAELSQLFEDEIKKREIRCIVSRLPDDDCLIPLAIKASMYALGKSQKEINEYPYYLFFKDVYTYLKAWLICSIDNPHSTIMPISVIGLNYPNIDKPDKNAYIEAIEHIIDDSLTEKNSTGLPRRIKKYLPSPEAREVVIQHLRTLIIEIRHFKVH